MDYGESVLKDLINKLKLMSPKEYEEMFNNAKNSQKQEHQRENKLNTITDLCYSHYDIQEVIDDLKTLFGDCVESKIVDQMIKMFNRQLKLAKQLVNDNEGWLEWFIFDNECGYREFNVVIGKKEFVVCSVNDILEVIEEDNKK